MLHVEDLRTHLGQLPSSPSLSPSPSPSSTAYYGDQEQPALPHALLVYDDASASARADYANFLQASRGFAQNYSSTRSWSACASRAVRWRSS